MLLAGCIKYVQPEKKSTAMGFFQAVYGFGMTLGPVLMGRLVDVGGSRTAFSVFGVCAVCAAAAGVLHSSRYPTASSSGRSAFSARSRISSAKISSRSWSWSSA